MIRRKLIFLVPIALLISSVSFAENKEIRKHVYNDDCLEVIMKNAAAIRLTLFDLNKKPAKLRKFVNEYKNSEVHQEIKQHCTPNKNMVGKVDALCKKKPNSVLCLYKDSTWKK